MGDSMRPDLTRILAFFKDDATASLAARQHALLKRVAKFPAFTLRELPVVAELLDLVAARLEGLDDEAREELEMTLCKVVRVCGRPGLREKSNEELLAPGRGRRGSLRFWDYALGARRGGSEGGRAKKP